MKNVSLISKIILSIVLITTISIIIAYLSNTSKYQSGNSEYLSQLNRVKNINQTSSLYDIEAIPKYDRPDLAVVQNLEMIKEPSTNLVPTNRTLRAFAKVKKNFSTLKAASDVNWIERGPNNVGGRTRALMFDPNDANGRKVWAGGVAGGLWYNNDITSSSSQWNNIDDFWANLAITSIGSDPSNSQVFYVGTGEGYYNVDAVRGAGIWKTTDGGTNWSQISSTDNSNFYYVQKVVITPSGTVIAATRAGLYRSTNGGTSWSELYTGRFADVEVASNGDIYASEGIFSSGVVRKSTNDGVSWTTVTPQSGGHRIELAIAPSDPNTIYAVASFDNDIAWFRKSTNGGSSWSNVDIPPYTTQSCSSSSSDDFARGQAWYNLILAVHPSNPNTVIVGGIDLYKTTNGGSSWSLISYWTGRCDADVHADQHAIQFSPANDNAAIFGNDGGVYYSSNVGSASNPSISVRNNGYNVTQFYAADQANSNGSNHMIAGAQDNGSHRFSSAGINSTVEVSGGDGAFCHVDQLNSNYQITSYVYNNYYRSTNGGSSFSSITNSNTGRFINPSEYDDNAKILYAAAGEDQYYRVSNITSSISRRTVSASLGGYRASAIKASPYTNNRIFIGTGTHRGSGGSTIFRVDNANGTPSVTEIGTSSLPSNAYISSIDVGASDNQIVLTYSNYGVTSVWETRDGGSTWSNKEGNLPDIPIRWVLYNPLNTNEVVVATELGVWSVENINVSSPNWKVSNIGLANVRCDMLQYRDSDGKVVVATHGRGLYTGNPFQAVADTEEPTIPTSLNSSNVGSSSFDVSWMASTDNVGVTGYNIYLNGTLQGSTSNTSYSFTGLASNTSYTVAIEATDAANNVSGQASLDVTTLEAGSGCNATVSTFPYNQSFESSIGSWEQESTDDIDWTRDNGGTPSSNTGPSSGAEGSYYLYIEASGNGTGFPDMNAIIYTPCLDVSSLTEPELTFSYHMYGTDVGSLVVESSTDNGVSWTNLWSISGSQGDVWNEATLTLPVSTGIKIRFNGTTGSGWSSDIAIDNIIIDEKTVVEPCPAISFESVSSYGGQDIDGDNSIQDSNATLLLENNTWKSISYDYTITSNTVLEFDFRSTSEGEIHGIGFDSDNTIDENVTFKLYGTQDWGITNYNNYSGSDWVHYSIPVGSYYTGTANRIFFVNDNDNGSGNNSYFRNVTVHEGDCGESIAGNISGYGNETITPIIGNEDEFGISLYPNPATNLINIHGDFENAIYSIFSISGQLMSNGILEQMGNYQQIDISKLSKGMYVLKVNHSSGCWTTEFSKK